MPWFFLVVSVLVLVSVANALWPVRRPWWLKLTSFNLGYSVNELPWHALIGSAVATVAFTAFGALDELPGRIALGTSAVSAIGLVVLAAAHRRAEGAIDAALCGVFGDQGPLRRERTLPRSWLVLPWLAWWRTPGVARIANIAYTTIAGRDVKLDVYRPLLRVDNCPVLVEIHGGGWIMGDRRLEARPLMATMAARGWLCVSVDYRIGRHATWPDHIIDVNTALAWVREHISEYGGDPEFITVTGGSAGGHLAALATLAADDSDYRPLHGTAPMIRACVPFYGAHDFDNALGTRATAEHRLLERFVVRVPMAERPESYARATPLARVNADAPPFMVIQGTSDNLVAPAEARELVSRLREVSTAPTVYAEIPRAQHAFDAVPSVRTAHVVSGVERFLTHIHDAHRISVAKSTTS